MRHEQDRHEKDEIKNDNDGAAPALKKSSSSAADALRIAQDRARVRYKEAVAEMKDAHADGEPATTFNLGQRAAYSDTIADLDSLLTEIETGQLQDKKDD